VGFHLPQTHYQLTRLAIALGPSNPLVQRLSRRRCAAFGVELEFSSTAVDIVNGSRIIRISPKNWLYAPSIASSFDADAGRKLAPC
jgi:hypothetical protein